MNNLHNIYNFTIIKEKMMKFKTFLPSPSNQNIKPINFKIKILFNKYKCYCLLLNNVTVLYINNAKLILVIIKIIYFERVN